MLWRKKGERVGSVRRVLGNVDEWVSYWYDDSDYANSHRHCPQGAATGVEPVLRGDSWFGHPFKPYERLRASSALPAFWSVPATEKLGHRASCLHSTLAMQERWADSNERDTARQH